MNARKGNWTLPQLLLDLEARVTELEAANHTVYVHHVSFDSGTIGGMYLDIINDTDTPFTSDTLLQYLLSLQEDSKITCTGFTATDETIISLRRVGNQINVGLPDTTEYSFTTLRLFKDYVEQIRI